MNQATRQHRVTRHETFTVVDDTLLRIVSPSVGKPYQHSCAADVFKECLRTIDECNGRPFVYEDLVGWTGHPHSQVATAFAFLKERSIIVPTYSRRQKAASDEIFLDGMIEWTANEHRGTQ